MKKPISFSRNHATYAPMPPMNDGHQRNGNHPGSRREVAQFLQSTIYAAWFEPADSFLPPPMPSRVVRHGPKRFRQSRSEDSQFFPVKNGKLMQQFLAMWSQFNQYFTMVLITMPASTAPCSTRRSTKLYRAVMAQAEPLREGGDGGPSSRRQPFDGEENLMLLWFDAFRPSSFFAEMQKLADPIAELGELAIPRHRNVSVGRFRANVLIAGNHGRSSRIVSRYNGFRTEPSL